MKTSTLQQEVAKDEEVIDVTIFGKNGEPYTAKDGSPSTIGVVGAESKRFRQAENAISRKNLRNHRPTTPDDLRAQRLKQHAACVVRWHGWEDENDAELPCTPENVEAVLGAADHVLDQVVAGVQGHASFFAQRSSS